MTLSNGTQLGPYEILSPLGAGGMGEVYRAKDARLDREVAIKVLPEMFSRDVERVARFQREAKVLASLNHPNIAAIYGFEESEDKHFLVMELVEGETLLQRIKNGLMPVEEALGIGKQIAEALEAAHECGVIHRDLKPGNVMVKPDGTVKVLDFGLAKAMSEDSSTTAKVTDSPTITADFTRPGVVLGTAPYMSPEQARGRPLDKRTDIWSFGVMLYECLTGEMLFRGETATDSMGAIMHRDPDWSLLPPNTPPTVQLLMRRLLTRDRNQRLKDIGDARIEIAHAIVDPTSSALGLAAAAIEEPKRARRRLLTALALAAFSVGPAAVTWFATASLRRPPPATMQLAVSSNTHAYKNASAMVVSPDGASVAFAARRSAGGQRHLWVRRLDEFDARDLNTTTSGGLFWSPDSQYIGFHADGKLWSIRADGADKRLLASVGSNEGATWNADGAIVLAGGTHGLQILRAGATSLEPLTTLNAERFETLHSYPHFLPDGNRYLYLAVTFDPEQEIRSRWLYAGDLATGEQTLIGTFSSNTWYVEPGYLVYVEDGTVKTVPFDTDRLRITGQPRILAQNASYQRYLGHAMISASRDGVVVFAPVRAQQRLVWFDKSGNRLGQVGPAATFDEQHRISPDGRTVAAGVADPRTELCDIVLYGLQRNTSRRLTVDARWEGQPAWSPDGKTVYFSTDHHGPPDVYSLEVDGGAAPQEVFSKPGAWFPTDASPDGRFLVIVGPRDAPACGIWVAPLDGAGEPFAFNPTRGRQRRARFSPDGNRIAYFSNENGADEIHVDTFPDSTGGLQVSTNGGFSPAWSPDGKKLYFGQRPSGDRDWAVMSVEFTDSDPPAPLPPVVLFNPGPFVGFDLAPDGDQFLLRLDPDQTPDNHVILNWLR